MFNTTYYSPETIRMIPSESYRPSMIESVGYGLGSRGV